MSHSKIILGSNHAGLGGRLKTIAWGKALAAFAHLDYKFIWPLSDACGGDTLDPGKDLFENADFYIPNTPWLSHNDWMLNSASDKQNIRNEKMQSYAAEFLSHNTEYEVTFDFSQDDEKSLKAFAEKYNVSLQYIGAGVVLPNKNIKPLYDKYIYELRNLTPSNKISSTISEITDTDEITSCIGVHVRRGDVEEHGSKFSGLMKRYVHEEQYFKLLDTTDESAYSRIFLCTESEEVIRSFKERYGSRVIYRPIAENHRGSVEGVQDAFADILLLSRCKTIVGGHSNFSELAALIGGIKIHLLNS